MVNSILDISDLSEQQVRSILDLKDNNKFLDGKNIGLLFEKYSTRTRLSFLIGIKDLGGNTINLRLDELNISREETFEDTFRTMNCYLDGLIYRTTNHEKLLKASNFFKKPIINALSNKSHPCQALSDMYTINEHFGSLNINILWMGDMNNVCYSLVQLANLISEIQLTICSPKIITDKIDWSINNNINIINETSEINLENVKCVMTDVFVSMNDEINKTKVSLLEKYSVNSELMSSVSDDCIFMHCLPAKVGSEVSEEVFRGTKSIVWKQAYNRLVAQKKLIQLINWL